MNRPVKIVLLAVLLLIMAAPAAFATPIVAGDFISVNSWNALDNAGLIGAEVSGGGQQFNIETYCIQDNVYISPYTSYKIGNVSDIVGWSPSNPNGNPSIAGEGPLAGPVNWLYAQYSGNKFGTLNAGQQADFQNLLWNLQGEGSKDFSTSTPWYQDYVNNYAVAAAANPSGQWGTEVLNIVDSSGTAKQNLLVGMTEPSTFLMLGAGLLGLLLISKARALPEEASGPFLTRPD